VQKAPKAVVSGPAASGGAFRLGCRLRIGLRKPKLPLRWSLRVRAIEAEGLALSRPRRGSDAL
jgi:hypothetical protein